MCFKTTSHWLQNFHPRDGTAALEAYLNKLRAEYAASHCPDKKLEVQAISTLLALAETLNEVST